MPGADGSDLDLALQSQVPEGLRGAPLSRYSAFKPATYSQPVKQQCACLPQPCKDKTEIALPAGTKTEMVKQIHVFLSPCGPLLSYGQKLLPTFCHVKWQQRPFPVRKEKCKTKSSLPMMDDLWSIPVFIFSPHTFLSVRYDGCNPSLWL